MITIVVLIHIIACLFLIGVVLLQQGKGADLAGAFGGGGTQSVFGARGSVTLLHKLTTAGFVIFILTSVFLGIFQRRSHDASVMKSVPAAAQKETPAAPKAAQPKPAEAPAPGQAKPAEAPAPSQAKPAAPAPAPAK